MDYSETERYFYKKSIIEQPIKDSIKLIKEVKK